MSWDAEVLEYCWDFIDYISLHNYAAGNGSTADYLAHSELIDKQIESMAAACRYVQAKLKRSKPVHLCFDEWNVWYKNKEMDGRGKKAPHLIEEVYNLEDAVVVAGFLNSFIRHSDVVKIANIAQIVNVIAPILTDGDKMLLQSIYYVFDMYSRRRRGTALTVAVDGESYRTTDGRDIKYVDASAIIDEGRLSVFACNRNLDESMRLVVDLADASIKGVVSADMIVSDNAKDANSYDNPAVVISRDISSQFKVIEGRAVVEMPPLSVTAATFETG
jgi:alpha-N-arabinofuranosidase